MDGDGGAVEIEELCSPCTVNDMDGLFLPHSHTRFPPTAIHGLSSYRVEGQAEDVLKLFLPARAEEQRCAVDVRHESEGLSQYSFPGALVVLCDDKKTIGFGSRKHLYAGLLQEGTSRGVAERQLVEILCRQAWSPFYVKRHGFEKKIAWEEGKEKRESCR